MAGIRWVFSAVPLGVLADRPVAPLRPDPGLQRRAGNSEEVGGGRLEPPNALEGGAESYFLHALFCILQLTNGDDCGPGVRCGKRGESLFKGCQVLRWGFLLRHGAGAKHAPCRRLESDAVELLHYCTTLPAPAPACTTVGMSYGFLLFKLALPVTTWAELNTLDPAAYLDMGAAEELRAAISAVFPDVRWTLDHDAKGRPSAWFGVLEQPGTRLLWTVAADEVSIRWVGLDMSFHEIDKYGPVRAICDATGWTAFDGQVGAAHNIIAPAPTGSV